METLEQLLERAVAAHGHLCAGQILGVRMAMYGLGLLGIADPRGADRKRLVAFVEIDRCATDAIGVVTGCRVGKRTLKLRDWGKMAATFVDLAAGRAVRVVALEDSRQLAQERYPELSRNEQQMAAYRELREEAMFRAQWVRVPLDEAELPGYRAARMLCARCGEGINFGRGERVNDETLCVSCAHPDRRYWCEL